MKVFPRADTDLPEAVPFEDILAVERFDRGPNGQRIHIEEFAQVLQYEPRQKYGKDMQKDFVAVLTVLEQLSARPSLDVPEFVRRFVTFILMGNTDAHLKNWALMYPDCVNPVLAPMYDPVCVTSFFTGVSPLDYAINRAVDTKLKSYTWKDLEDLLKQSKVMRRTHLIKLAKDTVKQAKAEWPSILIDAPDSVRKSVTERLSGGVAIAQIV